MGFLQIPGIGDVKEAETIPECETGLTVSHVKAYVNDNGRQIIRITHEIDQSEHPDAANVMHFMNFPKEDDEPNTVKLMMLGVRRYLEMANVPFEAEGFNEEDLMGLDFTAKVDQKEDDDGEVRNHIILPKLRNSD